MLWSMEKKLVIRKKIKGELQQVQIHLVLEKHKKVFFLEATKCPFLVSNERIVQ
jgi:hypothetical protein